MPEQPITSEPKALDYFCGFEEFQRRANLVIRETVVRVAKLRNNGNEVSSSYYLTLEQYFKIPGFGEYMIDTSKRRVWGVSEVRGLANLCLTDAITLSSLLQPFNFKPEDTNYWVAQAQAQGFFAGHKDVQKHHNSPPGVFRAEQPTEQQALNVFVYLKACEEIDELVKQRK
jgi:hypothetical protein